jgi:hypothetical protein
MSGSVSDLLRDAASLHRFITSIARRRQSEKTHRLATEEFLNYIQDLSESAQRFLQDFTQRVSAPSSDPDDLARFDRPCLATIREFWGDLHEFVRPAEDADTLSIPVALIQHLEDEVSKLPGLNRSRLVISHTSELNYVEYPRSDLRFHAQAYDGIVTKGPAFPAKMALIAMPYSQDAALFLNLVICHELGHFAFEELDFERQLSSDIEDALKGLEAYASMSEPDLSWCRERLKYWSEEIYCDRFAIGLIGPAFCFAYIELWDIVATASDADESYLVEFYDTHPSDACRFREHSDQLKKGDWWSLLIENTKSSYIPLIQRLADIDPDHYVFASDQKPHLADPVLKAFIKMKPKLADLVDTTFGPRLRRFRGDVDKEEIHLVKSYLSRGVVPSTLIRKRKERFPDPVALINAAYLFYLESMAELMQRIAGQKEENLCQRSKWAERVESWTLKALEDLRLTSSPLELTNGSAIEQNNQKSSQT